MHIATPLPPFWTPCADSKSKCIELLKNKNCKIDGGWATCNSSIVFRIDNGNNHRKNHPFRWLQFNSSLHTLLLARLHHYGASSMYDCRKVIEPWIGSTCKTTIHSVVDVREIEVHAQKPKKGRTQGGTLHASMSPFKIKLSFRCK